MRGEKSATTHHGFSGKNFEKKLGNLGSKSQIPKFKYQLIRFSVHFIGGTEVAFSQGPDQTISGPAAPPGKGFPFPQFSLAPRSLFNTLQLKMML